MTENAKAVLRVHRPRPDSGMFVQLETGLSTEDIEAAYRELLQAGCVQESGGVWATPSKAYPMYKLTEKGLAEAKKA